MADVGEWPSSLIDASAMVQRVVFNVVSMKSEGGKENTWTGLKDWQCSQLCSPQEGSWASALKWMGE